MSSSDASQRQNTNITNTSNYDASSVGNLTGSTALSGIKNSNVSITTTSADALKAAGDIAKNSFDFGNQLATTAFSSINRAGENALNFGGQAVSEALNYGENLAKQAIDATQSSTADLAAKVLNNQTQLANQTLQGLTQAAQSQNVTIFDQLTKFGIVAAVAIAAIFIFRKQA